METIAAVVLLFGIVALGILGKWIHGLIFYWQRKGVPAVGMVPFLGSYYPYFFRKYSVPEFQEYIYSLNVESKYIGMMEFHTPSIVVKDPELIKQIGIEYFDHFPDHKTILDEEKDSLFGKLIFFASGRRWRKMRTALTPFVRPSQCMVDSVSNAATAFVGYLQQHPAEASSIEMKDAFSRVAADTVISETFGLNFRCIEDKGNAVSAWAKIAWDLGSMVNLATICLNRAFPRPMRWLGVFAIIKGNNASFLTNLVKHTLMNDGKMSYVSKLGTIHAMARAVGNDSGTGTDFDETASLAFNLVFGGIDTSSTLMCYAAHELAVNPDIQDRLRAELDRCMEHNDGLISREMIRSMEYMDAVIAEVLRKYPVVSMTDRRCKKAFELPPALPGGSPVTLEPGMFAIICIYAMHHDPKFFPNPDKFDPERFSKENKPNIVPYSYIPFGVGYRSCMGERYAKMETKLILAHLLAKFILKPTAKTRIPLQFSKGSVTMEVKGGFWLELKARVTV